MADSWDIVTAGSGVPAGVQVGHWVCLNATAPAFYDLDTLYCYDQAIERLDDRDIASGHAQNAEYCV